MKRSTEKCWQEGLGVISPEQLAALSPADKAKYLQNLGIESLNRYAGKPDLLLKEHPHRDFRNQPPFDPTKK